MPAINYPLQDGTSVKINVPDSATRDQIDAYVDSQIKSGSIKLKSETPSQYIRSGLQGLSLGFSDEIEAAVRSAIPGGPDYDVVRNEVRNKLADFKKSNPGGAITAEVLGAIVPAVATTIAALGTGGAATPAAATTIGRLIKIGAIEGGIGGLGTSESETIGGQVGDTLTGTAAGAVLSPVAGYAGQKAAPLLTDFVNFVRTKFGDRASDAATSEIRRLADATGKTYEEIARDIADGRIMAENRTLQATARAYRSKGGEGAAIITDALPERVKSTENIAMRNLQEELAPDSGDNVLKAMNQSDKELGRLESESYKEVFGSVPEVSTDIASTIDDTVKRFPDAFEKLNKIYGESNRLVPLFKEMPNGEMVLARIPTLEDAEIVRRTLDEEASKLYRSGDGTRASNYAESAKQIRSQLDINYPELGNVRAGARQRREIRDSFVEGQRALGRDVEQVEIDFEALKSQGEHAVNAYRMGIMNAIKNKAKRPNTLMAKLSDPERQEGAVLSIVYPEKSLEEIQKKLDIAGMAKETAGKVLQGSMTAPEQAAASQIGSGVISASEMARVFSGDPIALINATGALVSKAIGKEARLSPADVKLVSEVLVSEDPQFVLQALTDNSLTSVLIEKARNVMMSVASGGRRAATFEGSSGLVEEKPAQSMIDYISQDNGGEK